MQSGTIDEFVGFHCEPEPERARAGEGWEGKRGSGEKIL